jgi:tetratricopeptide (TPR) repeat protein
MKKILIVFALLIVILQSNAQSANSLIENAVVKVLFHDYRGAIADYSKAIELNPKYDDAYNNRGIAKFQLRDKNGACSDWNKANELGNKAASVLIKKLCNE